jgi:hypothetical protein
MKEGIEIDPLNFAMSCEDAQDQYYVFVKSLVKDLKNKVALLEEQLDKRLGFTNDRKRPDA